jgi:hypothetical protein
MARSFLHWHPAPGRALRAAPALLLACMLGCASLPYQELSDARQAIRSAQEAGAEQRAPDDLRSAQAHLERARGELDAGNYSAAREAAEAARNAALQARRKALEGDGR